MSAGGRKNGEGVGGGDDDDCGGVREGGTEGEGLPDHIFLRGRERGRGKKSIVWGGKRRGREGN